LAKLLITGGTGSFGNAAVKRFLDDSTISKIVVFSRDELKQHNMRQEYSGNTKLEYIVGDVRDKEAILRASRGIDFIFHAAALKHVPTGEYFPMELIQTNILGTENVLSSAEANNVRKVVFLSTDKAAYPINTMGMTKAIAEKLIGSRARDSKSTVFCSVRYGNVMASRGSVIPLFVDQIKEGKTITITDPKMTRFLMSLDDSIDLVDVAIKKGRQGDLFVKKAPAATIEDLARALLNIFKAKNSIQIIGTRAGEKIHETLATQLELSAFKDLGDYYCIKEPALFDYKSFYEKGGIDKIKEDYTSENTKRLSVSEIEKLLLSLDYIQSELKSWRK